MPEVVSPPILPNKKSWLDLLWTDIVDNWRTIPDEAIIIVLLGPSGSGRSTFINTAIGRQRCATSGSMTRRARLGISSVSTLDSVTKGPQRVHYETDGQNFVFVDTPGLDLEDLSADQLKLSKERTVDGVIYLYPINRTRVTVSLREYENLFKILAGEDWEKKMLFVTTMWDEIDDGGGEKTQLQLENNYWKQATDKGAIVDRFLGGNGDAWRLINRMPKVQVSTAVMKTVEAKAKKEIVIAIMGPTGAGKSTFISHAYGKAIKGFVGHGLKRCTSSVQSIKVTSGNHRVTLVDTPGFDDHITDSMVLAMIADWLQETYSNQVKLAGIIYMHRISDNRITEGIPFKNSKRLAQICGTSVVDRLVLVTTMWGCVTPDVGQRREEILKNNYWKGLIDKNAKVARFDATFESAQSIIWSVYEPLARGSVKNNHNQPNSARRGLQTNDSDDIPSITPYVSKSTSTQGEPPPHTTHSSCARGEKAQIDGANTSSLQEIPDEDDCGASENDQYQGADRSPDATISLTDLQVDEKPRNLQGPNSTTGHTKVEVDVCLPENDHVTDRRVGGKHVAEDVLGCSTDTGRKIVADADLSSKDSSDTVNGSRPRSHKVRGDAESSDDFEKSFDLNPSFQNKREVPTYGRDGDGQPVVRNVLRRHTDKASSAANEYPPPSDSDTYSLSPPAEGPVAAGNYGIKKEFSRFNIPRNKPKEVAAYIKKAGKIFKVKTEDLKEDDVIIAVMGPIRSGKSSFINMATGNATGVGHDLESCTNSIDILKFQCIERWVQDIIFVDTPGFDDIHKSDVETLEIIADWLKQMYEQNVKLAGILYFHRITDNRKAGVLKNLHMFEKLCGAEALRNTILTTTMWDEADETFGEREELRLKQGCWKSMMRQGAKTMRYGNTQESAWNIIDEISSCYHERYALDLQKELIDERKELPETGAGRELFTNLSNLVKEQQDALHCLVDSMRKHDDEVILNALKGEYEELRIQKEATVREMEVLKIRRGKRHFLGSRLGFLPRGQLSLMRT